MDEKHSAPGVRTEGKKTQILFVVRALHMGGVEKVLETYLTQLAQNPRVQCSVLCFEPIREQWVLDMLAALHMDYFDGYQMAPVPKKTFFLLKWVKKLYYHFQRKSLPYRLKPLLERFDVLVDFTIYCANGLRLSSKPKIGWYHGGFSSFDFKEKQIKIISGYEKIVCLTQAFAQDLAEALPELAPRLTHIYNPLDTESVRRLSEEKPEVPLEQPYFVAVQRVVPEKDTETLIRAFQAFRRKHPEYRLYIVGDGSLLQQTMEKTDDPHIVFTGRSYNPYPIVKGARALVLSSTLKFGEGLGMVLLEAQALGVLSISSDVKYGPREILMDGKAGILFEPESEESCCAAMCRAVENPEETAEMVRTATENLHRFYAENNVRQFLRLIGVQD